MCYLREQFLKKKNHTYRKIWVSAPAGRLKRKLLQDMFNLSKIRFCCRMHQLIMYFNFSQVVCPGTDPSHIFLYIKLALHSLKTDTFVFSRMLGIN